MAAALGAARQPNTQVTVYEASRALGGRARSVDTPEGALDNGQHILIGAYSECLALMKSVGIDIESAFTRLPLELRYPDGIDLVAPRLPAPLHLLMGIAGANGLSRANKVAWITTSLRWKLAGWRAKPGLTVQQLCRHLPPIVMQRFIEPLCVSALNTPASGACAQVFLNVLQGSLGASRSASDYLLPRLDLSALFPNAASNWLTTKGHNVLLGNRVQHLEATDQGAWLIDGQPFDAVIIAAPPWIAASLLQLMGKPEHQVAVNQLKALEYAPITTVYAFADRPLGITPGNAVPRPMMALATDEAQPFQFVFDRTQLGLTHESKNIQWAFVVSDSRACAGYTDSQWTEALSEAAQQLRIGFWPRLDRSITEKRATFVCKPRLQRPATRLSPGLALAGDYVAGPYPSTLEGAVRSGIAAAAQLKIG